MGDLGARLRQARTAKGMSLREIEASTKISVPALEALERNEYGKLPGGIFSRAFVRAYASAVGLDPEPAVQEFLAEFSRYERDAERFAKRPEVTPDDLEFLEKQRRALRTLRVVLAIVALAGLAALAYLVFVWRPAARGASGAASAPVALSTPAGGGPLRAHLREPVHVDGRPFALFL